MTKLLATSVIRGSEQGDSHGGAYLVDFDKRTVQMEETRKAQRAEPVAEEKPSQP